MNEISHVTRGGRNEGAHVTGGGRNEGAHVTGGPLRPPERPPASYANDSPRPACASRTTRQRDAGLSRSTTLDYPDRNISPPGRPACRSLTSTLSRQKALRAALPASLDYPWEARLPVALLHPVAAEAAKGGAPGIAGLSPPQRHPPGRPAWPPRTTRQGDAGLSRGAYA